MKKILLLSSLILILFACNQPGNNGSNEKSHVNSLFAPGDTINFEKSVNGDTKIVLYKENGDTVHLLYSEEIKTFTYTVPKLDTIVKRKVTGTPPTNPPTEPPPPSTGIRQNIVYQDMFETADPGSKYKNEQQWCCSYSVTSATDIVREGARSVRMEHRGSDPKISSGERVELKSSTNFKSLPEVWYGYSVYFRSPWEAFSGNEHLPQWHPQSSGGGMVLGMWTGKGTFDLRTNPSGGSSSSSLVSSPKRIETNKWYDFVWHIKWGNPGLLEVWINGEVYFSKIITTSTSGIPYFKFGLNGWNYPSTLNRVFYMDALRIGNEKATYKDVAP